MEINIIMILIYGIVLLLTFSYVAYKIEKIDEETNEYLDENYDKYGDLYIRK